MSSLDGWNLIVAFLLPLIIAVVQQPGWSQPARALAMAVCCILAAVGINYFSGAMGVPVAMWAQQVVAIAVVAISTYKGFWQPMGIAPAIERATKLGGQNDGG
jgi:hypothetical protein